MSQIMFNTASNSSPSTSDPSKTWAQAGAEANAAISDETTLECRLGWTGDEECK